MLTVCRPTSDLCSGGLTISLRFSQCSRVIPILSIRKAVEVGPALYAANEIEDATLVFKDLVGQE